MNGVSLLPEMSGPRPGPFLSIIKHLLMKQALKESPPIFQSLYNKFSKKSLKRK